MLRPIRDDLRLIRIIVHSRAVTLPDRIVVASSIGFIYSDPRQLVHGNGVYNTAQYQRLYTWMLALRQILQCPVVPISHEALLPQVGTIAECVCHKGVESVPLLEIFYLMKLVDCTRISNNTNYIRSQNVCG